MCPTMRWSGRTASPSTCHGRSSDSQALGSAKAPWPRSASTVRLSWVVVATYAQTTPPGTKACATVSTTSHGRQHVEHDAVDVGLRGGR